MPELPEVETTRRGIEPHLVGRTVAEVIVKRRDLRAPVSESVSEIEGLEILKISRRSKYLLLELSDTTTLLIHLGMSGSLRIVPPAEDWKKHDHFALTLKGGKQLRFHDPRRFGLVLHLAGDPLEHALLRQLGPEPLEEGFSPEVLYHACVKRAVAIKLVIMDAKVVVGVGNIYASEALYRSGILPQTPANKISKARVAKLVAAIREVLEDSITQGGTTLRDFLHSNGEPGYFKQRLFVYGRAGEPCRKCGREIQCQVLGQRSTFWCGKCQRG